MIDAIVREIHIRKDYLSAESLQSIYLGGGTPSLLNQNDLDKIFAALSRHYQWDDKTEITLEANPDDLSKSKLKSLHDAGFNRLSIGIQSFNEADLRYMNRAHSAKEAEECIQLAQDIGFEKISADLIYGSPTTSDEAWVDNIEKMLSFNLPHISAYCLTVEEGTALHHFVTTGKSQPVDEEKASNQFDILISTLTSNGYDHYEISNFGKPGSYAVHNTNYWMRVPYLGIGPAAHSFDGESTRSWNIAHNPKYISSLKNNSLPIEHETLTLKEMYNEYLMIRLRTKWGINNDELIRSFPQYTERFYSKVSAFMRQGKITLENGAYILTNRGKHLADRIAMELFEE